MRRVVCRSDAPTGRNDALWDDDCDDLGNNFNNYRQHIRRMNGWVSEIAKITGIVP